MRRASSTGTQDLGNSHHGVLIDSGAENNIIGEGNVISGNERYGIVINASATAGNTVVGNYIGTGATGRETLGNEWSGVALSNGAQNNAIGPGNVIAHHACDGVDVLNGGTTGNVITQNSISDSIYGIHLFGGANGGIEPPAVASITLGSIEITGTACALCTVELFGNGDDDGEGEAYMGSTAAYGSGDFARTLASCAGTHFLTTTATASISGTSEFSAQVETGLSWVLLPMVSRAP
jgi:hypothetical protein